MNLDQINDLHERAMSLAQAAIIARTEGDLATAGERFQEALELAAEAAAEIAPPVAEEPDGPFTPYGADLRRRGKEPTRGGRRLWRRRDGAGRTATAGDRRRGRLFDLRK